MAAALNPRAEAPSSRFGSERYWAPCLAVALVAIALFYATLKDLVRESAARAPTPAPAVMPAYVETKPPTRSAEAPVSPTPYRTSLTNARYEAPTTTHAPAPAAEPAAEAVPAFVEVQKCVMPEGDAFYSDAPCPEGASASTLRLPRNVHASARL